MENSESYVHYRASKTQERLTECIDEAQSGFFPVQTQIHPTIRETYPSTCCTTAYSHTCTGPNPHTVHVPILDNSEGHRKQCPVCSANEASRKAVKTFHEILAYDWHNLRFIELTTPEDFIPPESIDLQDEVRAKINLLFRLGREYMKRCHPQEPYIAFLHTWHSSNPCSKPHLHLHIISAAANYQLDDSRRVHIQHHVAKLSRKALDDNRATWSLLLGVQESDIFYRYSPRRERHHHSKGYGGPARLMHRLKYCYRAFIQDVNTYFERNETEHMTPERLKWANWHMQKFPRKVRRYGAWAPKAQRIFIHQDEVKSRVSTHFENAKTLYCPKCYYPISNLPTDPEPATLDTQSLAVRKRVTYRVPPSHCMREQSNHPTKGPRIPIHQIKGWT
jgi:hypothetical protein